MSFCNLQQATVMVHYSIYLVQTTHIAIDMVKWAQTVSTSLIVLQACIEYPHGICDAMSLSLHAATGDLHKKKSLAFDLIQLSHKSV